jgi:MFS family permease
MPRNLLPTIVLAQFCCTSLWFAGNAVMDELVTTFQLPAAALGTLTSAIQFGFICGTLVFAVLAVADRFSPSRVFLLSALAAAVLNLAATAPDNTLWTLAAGRFGVGFFLAGIYPVGMKIASDYYQTGLGKSLGFLVGALVLGTAFPHLLKTLGGDFPWRHLLWCTSCLAIFGGSLIGLFVPDGPHRAVAGRPDLTAFFRVFRNRDLRSAAFGYFGHMWELYAFWAFVPLLLVAYQGQHPAAVGNVSAWSFAVIGVGGVACVIGGYLSARFGVKRVAATALLASGGCCVAAPFLLGAPPLVFLPFLLGWGMVVVADSPLFSTLVAGTARPELKGTALTIVNCLGFTLTIISIQLLSGLLAGGLAVRWLPWLLVPGPLLGLIGLYGGAAAGAKEDGEGAG